MGHHEKMFRHEHAHKLDDPERRTWLSQDDVIARLSLRPGMRVADLGAGTGYFTLPIARAVQPGGHVDAVDMQPEMLDHLRGRLEPGLPVTLVQGEIAATTLGTATVDLAFLANVWHEIDDAGAALLEIARIVVPGGRIAILDWRTDVAYPPGPVMEHRIAASAVQLQLRSAGWLPATPVEVGTYSYLVTASAI